MIYSYKMLIEPASKVSVPPAVMRTAVKTVPSASAPDVKNILVPLVSPEEPNPVHVSPVRFVSINIPDAVIPAPLGLTKGNPIVPSCVFMVLAPCASAMGYG